MIIRRQAISFFALMVAIAVLRAPIDAHADILRGTVVGVSDGDTITVLDRHHLPHKIRILGIDAPEKAQPFGQRAKQHLSNLVFGKTVDVQWSKQDRYQRILGKVMVAAPSCIQVSCVKNTDAGLDQLTTGLAWWYRQYAKDQPAGDAKRYRSAEQAARTHRIGLWSTAKPTPPWKWRHNPPPKKPKKIKRQPRTKNAQTSVLFTSLHHSPS